jgi:hypothetical protein
MQQRIYGVIFWSCSCGTRYKARSVISMDARNETSIFSCPKCKEEKVLCGAILSCRNLDEPPPDAIGVVVTVPRAPSGKPSGNAAVAEP